MILVVVWKSWRLGGNFLFFFYFCWPCLFCQCRRENLTKVHFSCEDSCSEGCTCCALQMEANHCGRRSSSNQVRAKQVEQLPLIKEEWEEVFEVATLFGRFVCRCPSHLCVDPSLFASRIYSSFAAWRERKTHRLRSLNWKNLHVHSDPFTRWLQRRQTKPMGKRKPLKGFKLKAPSYRFISFYGMHARVGFKPGAWPTSMNRLQPFPRQMISVWWSLFVSGLLYFLFLLLWKRQNVVHRDPDVDGATVLQPEIPTIVRLVCPNFKSARVTHDIFEKKEPNRRFTDEPRLAFSHIVEKKKKRKAATKTKFPKQHGKYFRQKKYPQVVADDAVSVHMQPICH